jgi:glucosamine-phosphate N-acetyltransferase|tara:strand:+ start:214 stop:648 length:435 start_codon:yes stop_codon:yes gene_type:complete
MIRELETLDLDDNYFNLLCQLSGKPQELHWETYSIFWLKYSNNDDHQAFVYEDEGRVIGTATVLIENKLLHYGSRVGHIEDVVVDKNIRKSGVGRELVKACVDFGRYKECYKVILDCSKENVPFYEGCGFTFSENCMRIDLGEK